MQDIFEKRIRGSRSVKRAIDRIAWGLAALFALDRAVKLLGLERAVRHPPPSTQTEWPRVSLMQPITRGVRELAHNLAARARLCYPGSVQHLFICDATDEVSLAACHDALAAHPGMNGVIIPVESATGVAAKIAKLQAALPQAAGDILCFIDDDVAPRPDALTRIVGYLSRPRAGAAFGLPCYTSWENGWSSLMSGFVNANMPLSFMALTYLTDPVRITGHIAAYPRAIFEEVGGLDGLEAQIDDDFELARRLHAHGYHAIQTPVVYDIANHLPSARAYHRQLHRWFVLPAQSMFPSLTTWQRCASFLVSGPTLLVPGMLALLALATRRRSTAGALAASLSIFGAAYAVTERRYLRGRMPLRRWLLLPMVAIATPLHAVATLLTREEIEWRGQRLRVGRDGRFEVLR